MFTKAEIKSKISNKKIKKIVHRLHYLKIIKKDYLIVMDLRWI